MWIRIVTCHEQTSNALSMARILKGSHSFTCTPCNHLLIKWSIPAFSFPAEAGPHFPTPEG